MHLEGESMTFKSLGRFNVAAPGTPVPLTNDPAITACRVFFQVIPGLTGKTYIGAPSMTKGTLAGVVRILWPNSSGGFSETFEIKSQDGENSIRLKDCAIDADVAGEGLLVTYWTE
jgi:hypothetical protein